MDKKVIALFDMDNTLCDYDIAMKTDLKQLMSPLEVECINYHKPAPKYFVKRMSLIKSQQGWWEDLPELKLGMDIYNAAKEIGYDIHILTKGPETKPNAWSEKVKWCKKHLGQDTKITITQDKSLVYGKVLVDDYPDYVLNWLNWRKRGLCIMPEHHYNEKFQNPQVLKYNGKNIKKIKQILKVIFDKEQEKI